MREAAGSNKILFIREEGGLKGFKKHALSPDDGQNSQWNANILI